MQSPERCQRLSGLTWKEAERALRHRPIGLLPIGATEAHGPHLPLDTDTIIAEATALRAGERLATLGFSALILPPISYTVTFAGTSFAGTSPVDPEPFEQYLTSILTHLCRSGVCGLVLCNAHLEPAHVDRVQAAARSATAATGVIIATPDQRSERFALLLSDEFRAGSRHAGAYETSIVLSARPEQVKVDVMRQLPPVWIDLPARLRDGARTFTEAGATQGYFGDPASATADEGERMLDALADIVVVSCRELGMLSGPL